MVIFYICALSRLICFYFEKKSRFAPFHLESLFSINLSWVLAAMDETFSFSPFLSSFIGRGKWIGQNSTTVSAFFPQLLGEGTNKHVPLKALRYIRQIAQETSGEVVYGLGRQPAVLRTFSQKLSR